MTTPENAEALLALIAEQQLTIVNLRKEVEAAKNRADDYWGWYAEEKDKVKELTDKLAEKTNG